MSERDVEYQPMKQVLQCTGKCEVEAVLNGYNDDNFTDHIQYKLLLAQTGGSRKEIYQPSTMSSLSPAGVGTTPSIIAQALPSPLSPLEDINLAYVYNDDFLSHYSQSLSPGVGTSTMPPLMNTPPAGAGTAGPRPLAQSTPIRSPSAHSPRSTGSVAGIGASPPPAQAGPSGFSTRRDVPGRAPTPPGRGYMARTTTGRTTMGYKTPARRGRGGKQPRRGRGGKKPRHSFGGPGRGRGGPGRGGPGRGGAGGGGGGDDDNDDDDESSAVSTPRRMDQDSLQHQLQILLNDQ